MQPAALRTQALGHRAQERDHVVLALALDLVGSLRIHGGCLERGSHAFPVPVGHDAGRVQRLCREELDPQPQLELAALAEYVAHLGQCVAVDHRASVSS